MNDIQVFNWIDKFQSIISQDKVLAKEVINGLEKRFNIVRTIENRQTVVEYGLYFSEALTAICGRYKDTVKNGVDVKYKVVMADM